MEVPGGIAAYINGLGVQTPTGYPAFYVIENWDVTLDGLDCRNVIFKNCKVVYHGGGFRLENSQFNNCSFDIPRTLPGQRLATTLFASTAVTERAN